MPPIIDEATVRHVAHLARLALSDSEISEMTVKLGSILQYVQQLNSVDTTGVPPTAHPLPITNILRDDEPRPSLDRAAALANAPRHEDGFFVLPKVLEQ